ncbi:YSNK protein, partial [Amia calva]|nr:YSNK protein [Amia calva]
MVVPVENAKAFVVSAYSDERFFPGMVRVIGIVDRAQHSEFYCHFCEGTQAFSSMAQLVFHSDHFGFPYGTADFLCQTPRRERGFRLVSVSVNPQVDPADHFLSIQNTEKNVSAGFPYEFTVCISTLFGNYNNVLQFIQAMEMYRLLGAQKVLVYKSSCSPQLQSVLDYYKALGVLEVIPWNIHLHLNVSSGWLYSVHPGDLHYHGQVAALNDCVYRSMYTSHYVVLNDIDEIIVPRLHQDWGGMMRFLSSRHLGVNAFLFENSVFPNGVFGDEGAFDLQRWAAVPGVNILRHVHREPYQVLAFNARKLIVNPRGVIWTSVHKVLWLQGDWLKVSGTVARMHHYRTPDQPQLPREQLIRDTSLWRYNTFLVKNVVRVLHEVSMEPE